MPSYRVITAPDVLPVSLAEARLHLRVSGTDLDDEISRHIEAAFLLAEAETGRALAPQVRRVAMDAFPPASCGRNHREQLGGIKLPGVPVQSVEAVTYVDDDGQTVALADGDWQLDAETEPAWLLPAWGAVWPSSRANTPSAVRVDYACGYAENACPAPIRNWMLLHIKHLFDNGSAGTEGRPVEINPFTARLLDPYRTALV